MSIILSKEGKNAQRLDRTVIDQEQYLQNYIHHNPESLPLYEIQEDLRLLILSREFPTGSGPIDALGIDQSGDIYVIETKLYKNPDKRLVLAQVLDYGASLWRTYEDSAEFMGRLESAVNKTFNVSLIEKLQSFYEVDAETASSMLQNTSQNLMKGNFRFVVLMDRLEDRLKDLITFVNQNSRFDIFGVELEFYRFQEYEILIPKLYGAEVKKEVGVTRSRGVRKVGAKDFIRNSLTTKGKFTIEEGVAAGYTAITLRTALSDLKNPDYCGVGGPLNIQKADDGSFILTTNE